MKNVKLLTLGLLATAALGLAACGTGGPVTDGVCSLEEKADAKSVLENLDSIPLPEDAAKAIEAGCKASKENKDEFMTGVLGELSIDPACASDGDLQKIVDEWEGADLSDIPGTCSEGGPAPSESPIDPQKKQIDVTYDVFSIKGRGQFLVLNFSEAIKTGTVAASLTLLGDTSTDVPLENPAWNETRTTATYQVSSEAGDYRFAMTADGDTEGHALNSYLAFTIKAAEASDDDGDGVTDNLDKCPTTKAGEPVDATGCAKASDAPIWAVPGDLWATTINPAILAKLFPEPKVVESVPGPNATSFPVSWPIVIKFNQPMDPESVKQHVKLQVFALFFWGDVPMELTSQYGECTDEKHCTVFQFQPKSPLPSGHLKPDWAYRIIIEKGIKGDLNTSTAEDSWNFVTKK